MNSPGQAAGSQAPVPAGPVTAVKRPGHPLYALTTCELDDYRRQLEDAIASSGAQDPVSAVQADLQDQLGQVIAEQDDCARLAAHG